MTAPTLKTNVLAPISAPKARHFTVVYWTTIGVGCEFYGPNMQPLTFAEAEALALRKMQQRGSLKAYILDHDSCQKVRQYTLTK